MMPQIKPKIRHLTSFFQLMLQDVSVLGQDRAAMELGVPGDTNTYTRGRGHYIVCVVRMYVREFEHQVRVCLGIAARLQVLACIGGFEGHLLARCRRAYGDKALYKQAQKYVAFLLI